ncbi:hypothetical protein LPJ75_002977 [Coemansia sp. RSA 2598]|nr:hypothetical protein LPJ75_002977 [Coemansia sp. RSA 2598]
MMDSESLYWAQYDEDFDLIPQGPAAIHQRDDDYAQSAFLQNARQPSALMHYRQLAEPATSEYPSSRDSYWSRYVGNGSGSDQETPLGDAGSARASTSDMRRLLVMPERLASLRLSNSGHKAAATETTSTSTSTSTAAAAAAAAAAADSADHGSRSDHADNKAGGSKGVIADAVTRIDVEALAPMSADGVRIAQPIPAAGQQRMAAQPTGFGDLQRQGGSGQQPGPCGTTAAGYGGVNPIALITRLNFLKDQIEQNERLLLV